MSSVTESLYVILIDIVYFQAEERWRVDYSFGAVFIPYWIFFGDQHVG